MAIAYVQSASNTGTTTTLTITLGSPTTAGNCLVVATGASSTGPNPTSSGITLGGSAGNFAQLAISGTTTTSAAYTQIWADPNCAGGQTTVVVTWSGQPTTSCVWVYEFSGLAASSILDQSSVAFSTATQATFTSGTTPTTTQANELWFGANVGYNTTLTPPSSPWNNSAVINSGSRYLVAGYQIVSSTGTATYAGTYSPNSYETAAVVTLKTVAAGVAVATTTLAHVVQGVAVRRWMLASGGANPYTWSVTAGSLPAGLTLASDGTLSGTPTATGTSSFTVQATDAASSTATASLSVTSVSAPFSPSSPTTDGNGVITWNITSAINLNDAESIRVLSPTSPTGGYQHGFLITLPVNAGTDDMTYGNGLDTVRTLGLHNTYNLTVIEPSTGGYWLADNPTNAALLQESYLLQVVTWAKATYGAGGEKVYLIGFSRTGIAGQGMLFHRPDVYQGVASWDFPATMTGYDGTDPNHTVGGTPSASYGTADNFTSNYQLSPSNLAKWSAGQNFGTVNRIWIGGYHDFQADVTPYDTVLTSAGILHTYSLVSQSAHAWGPTPGWVATALAAIVVPATSSLLMVSYI